MNEASYQTSPGRLTSLDAMRGFTIAAMILVNYPGSGDAVFEPLEHATWNGLTPTDLIFPFFLFIVGVSIALAYTKLLDKGTAAKDLYRKILWRSVKIFAVGLFLSMLPTFDIFNIRITGVLQRIAIVFCCCSFIFLKTTVKTQAWMAAITLIVYWVLMTTIPTPGAGVVSLEPGVNLAAWVDSKLLPGAMWQGTWDPEGILSTFPSIVSGITGLLAGSLLLSKRTPQEKVILLMVFGMLGAGAGYVLGLVFPVNKNLWTSSFVLVTSGFAALALGATYFVVDIRRYAAGAMPGIIFGANAIAIYFVSDVISYAFYWIPFGDLALNEHFMIATAALGVYPKLASVFYALVFVVINFGIAYALYRKKIFIKL
jgi:predicted acyltransferase